MEKSSLQQFLTRKSIIIGIGFIVLASIVVLVLTSSQAPTIEPPQPTPTVQSEPATGIEKPIPLDKQVEGQIIVKFKANMTDEQIAAVLKKYDASIINEITGINYTVVKVPKGRENEIVDKLKADGVVDDAQGDYTNHLMYVPNDTSFALQYGLNNTGQTIKNIAGTANADIRAQTAWDTSRGTGVKIAVLDTGINLTHPELASKIVAQKSFTTATVEDQSGHGTHVAGIIAASTGNGQGIAGTCPDCQLIIGKVMGDDGTGTTSVIAQGVTWAADQGAKVINMSLGTTSSASISIYQSAIDYAISKGAVVVTSSGNCGGSNYASNGCASQNQLSYPGGVNNVITVASTDNKDQKSSFSNHGNHVEVTAPGTNIYSTFPNHDNGKGVLNYGYLSGTSMAAPMTAGVVGLIWSSQYGTSPAAVTERLYATADPISGTGQYWTKGRVNAAKAVGVPVATAAPTTPVTPTYVCAGSPAGDVCPPTPTSPPGTTIQPSVGAGTAAPTPISAEPTLPGSVIPTISGGGSPIGGLPGDPCFGLSSTRSYQPQTNSDEQPKMRLKNKDVSTQSFFDGFFEFFFRLILLFLQLLGGGGGTMPCGSITPTTAPQPTSGTQPTSGIQPTSGAQPTSGTQPTTAAATTPGASTGPAQTMQMEITGYSWQDNTPPGSGSICCGILHDSAGGTGTFEDPITTAVPGSGDSMEHPAGTKFYVPHIQRYVIVEDSGASPGSLPHLDIWVDGRDATASETDDCMSQITGEHEVEINPPAGRTVIQGPIYSGGCKIP